jgi:hypothetical protein
VKVNVAIAYVLGCATPLILIWMAALCAKHAAKARRN